MGMRPENILMCDTKGVIWQGRTEGMNQWKSAHAVETKARTLTQALEGADALFVVTEWNEFRHPDFERMKALMKTPVIFDGRNIYDPARMRELGFTYMGLGRK